jgi:hypothetical protein
LVDNPRVKSLNIVFPEPGRVEVREEPVPPLQPGEILVRTRRSLISTGTELTALRRDFEDGTFQQTYVRFPDAPGYSNAGVVEAVATDVTDFKPGDRVASRGKHGQLVAAPAHRAAKIPMTSPTSRPPSPPSRRSRKSAFAAPSTSWAMSWPSADWDCSDNWPCNMPESAAPAR